MAICGTYACEPENNSAVRVLAKVGSCWMSGSMISLALALTASTSLGLLDPLGQQSLGIEGQQLLLDDIGGKTLGAAAGKLFIFGQ